MVPTETYFERDVEYVFHIRKGKLMCKETLFVADEYPEDTATSAVDGMHQGIKLRESHYRYTHPKNSGKSFKQPDSEPDQLTNPA